MESDNPLEIRKRLQRIEQVLTAISKPSTNLRPEVAAELKRRTAGMLWDALPGHVATLDLGDGVSISRADDELKWIPLDKRETWDLARVDQMAATQARAVQQPWNPKFP